jgi:Transposase DDE domain group 1
MQTECYQESFDFQGLKQREVVGRFDGGAITSDGGGLLLREVDRHLGLLERFAACFSDYRKATAVEFTVRDLVSQRVMALALGYEDLNDHDELRVDPLLAVLAGRADPTGSDRERERDRGKALAGKSTLNRLELSRPETAAAERYKRIAVETEAVDRLLVDIFLEAHAQAPEWITIDLDATDDPIHGQQEGRFFHGYYRAYCYLPLYIFCGEHLLGARLRPSNIDASAGAVEELERIVAQIRQRWPEVKILIRADSGFCRDSIMAWCEAHEGIYYVLGLARNERLEKELAPSLAHARVLYEQRQQAARVFHEFVYRTRKSWSCARRVIGKAEVMALGDNPRFIVTNLSSEQYPGQGLYEIVYCARGDMENRIKEQQLALFADRTSTATLRANQLRLYFSSIAYTLLLGLRRLGLAGTELARAQCHTIRLKLLKIGAQVRVTVRKIWVAFSSAYPYRPTFTRIYHRLAAAP